MSRIHKYVDAGGAWSENISTAIRIGQTSGGPGGVKGLTQVAELGGYGTSGLEIDDVASTVGHSADGIIGLQQWTVDEDQAPAGSQRILTAWVADRRYRNSRVLPQLGTNVSIDVDLVDLNALFSFRKFAPDDTDAARPAETCQQRLDAVLASDLADGLIVAGALVELPSKGMAKHNYHGASLGDIIGDIAIQAGGLNWFARYVEANARVELGMYDPNTSTIDTSTMKLSNVAADVNSTTVFAPSGDEELTRSPRSTFSRIDVAWLKGTERVVRASTETTYARRDGTAPNATVKTAAKAREIGETFAWRNRNEHDVIRVTVPMRAAYVTSAYEGQRIQVKFRQFRGYTSYTWVRILRMTKTPWEGSEAGYDVAFELVPQGPAMPVTAIVQSAFGNAGEGGGTLTLPNPVTPGNLLVFCIGDRDGEDPIAPSTDSSRPRWGPGAWTKKPNVTAGQRTDGVAIWYKTADAVDQAGYVAATNAVIGIYELSNVDIASATTVSKDEQAAATTMDIGSLGSPVATSVNIMVGLWFDGSQYNTGTGLDDPDPSYVPRTGWTLDKFDASFHSRPILWNAPLIYIAHQIGTGAAMTAGGTRSALENEDGKWGGAAISIPPA